jgi:hypothetical protein
MHDREDPVSRKYCARLLVVREQTRLPVGRRSERRRHPRRVQRIDVACSQHPRQRLRLADRLDPDDRRQIELLLFGAPGLFLAAR